MIKGSHPPGQGGGEGPSEGAPRTDLAIVHHHLEDEPEFPEKGGKAETNPKCVLLTERIMQV